MKQTRYLPVHVVLLLIVACSTVTQAQSASGGDLVTHLTKLAATDSGVCVVLGAGAGNLPIGLVKKTDFLVHLLDPSADVIDTLRQSAGNEQIGIRRLLCEQRSYSPLPHADNIVDLVLASDFTRDDLGSLSAADVLRVLRPRGKALIRLSSDLGLDDVRGWAKTAAVTVDQAEHDQFGAWAVMTKPVPEGTDDWSHWEHGPDNNAVSSDRLIKAPYMTQFMAEPYYIAMPAITTTAAGRTYLAMGHIAHHEREEKWLNTLLARNAYNGAELWRRDLPDGYLVHRSAFIASEDVFYMIDPSGQGCLMLDAETGYEVGRILTPDIPGYWKWMALVDGTLYALVGKEPDPRQTTLVRSDMPHWSWGELSSGYYEREVPWGFGETLLAYDLKGRTVQWSYHDAERIDSRAMTLGDGKVFYYSEKSHLGCLEARTGKVVWCNNAERTLALIEEPGQGLSSTPGFRTACYAIFTPDAIVYQAQTRQHVVGVSPKDGALLWHHEKTTSNPNPIYLDGKIVTGIGDEGSTLVIDPQSGSIVEDLAFMKRSCARLTATPDSMFVRGMPEGITRYDRESGEVLFNGAMRPACNDGVIGANGLLYVGPWACDCNLSIMGSVAFCSAGDFDPATMSGERDTLAPAQPAESSPPKSAGADWATYRGNVRHTGSTPVSVSRRVAPLWLWHPDQDYTPTAPVAAGGLVYSAGDDGTVRAIDAASGFEEWRFETAGPIKQTPTISDGRVYVGSGDGYIYALDAAQGKLLWRFRAAPVERRTMIYGHLTSLWPVNSGILVHDGVAYAAAGIIDYDGTFVYALDAETGEQRWVNSATGHLDPALRKGVSAQGNLTIMEGKLWLAAGNVMPPAAFDLETGAYLGTTDVGDGSPRTNRGEEIAVFGDDILLTGGRLLYSSAENVVNPGTFTLAGDAPSPLTLAQGRVVPVWDERQMAVLPAREAAPVVFASDDLRTDVAAAAASVRATPTWQVEPLPGGKVHALALAEDVLIAAGQSNRFRTLEPRYHVALFDRSTGDLVCDQELTGRPRLNGIAVDRDGRIVIALTDGSMSCFGGGETFRQSVTRVIELVEGGDMESGAAIERLRSVWRMVHGTEERERIRLALLDLGFDVFDEARRNGSICTWRLLGPVPWQQTPAEEDLTDQLLSRSREELTQPVQVAGAAMSWQDHVTSDARGRMNLASKFGPSANTAVYAYAKVTLPAAANIVLRLGSNDGFVCWFNGKEVGRFDGGRSYRADQDQLPVHAEAGVNTILVKVNQLGGSWDLGVRITDEDGNAVSFTDGTPPGTNATG